MAHYRKKSRKVLKIFLALLFVALIALGVWYFFFRELPGKTSDTPAETVTPTSVDDAQKTPEEPETPEPTETSTEDPKKQTQNEGSDPNSSKTLTGALTRADVTNNKLIIRVNIDQYLSGGSCALTLTSGSKTYTDVANITDAASTSTCAGFDIPVEKLSSGSWSISIKITSGDKEGTISGKVTV